MKAISLTKRIPKLQLYLLFFVSVNHFMQRPLRDSMASFYGPENIHWLMTGTLAGTILISFIINRLEKQALVKQMIAVLFIMIAMLQLVFFSLFKQLTPPIAYTYYVFSGTTSLTLLSVIWRYASGYIQIVHGEIKYLIIANSIGALAGPVMTLVLSKTFGVNSILLLSTGMLLVSAFGFIQSKPFNYSLPAGTEGNKEVFPLKRIIIFTLLYTFIATGFYFLLLKTTNTQLTQGDQLFVFTILDLSVNSLVIITPIVIKQASSRAAFVIVPCLSLILFLTISFLPELITVVLAVGTFKLIHQVIQRPARELLFASSTLALPYSTKNFIDTTVYRLGDAVGAWAIAGLFAYGLEISQITIYYIGVSFLWFCVGHTISNKIKFDF